MNGDIGIGKLIDQERHRDAIHIAVAPVVAAHQLAPGDHVELAPDGKACHGDDTIGIVDPFLKVGPGPGEKFYLFLYPGSIVSLRHEWQHPAFSEEQEQKKNKKSTAQKYIEDFAHRLGCDYDELMNAAREHNTVGEYMLREEGSYDWTYGNMKEFWAAYEEVTGEKPKDNESAFFSCSC